MEEKQTATSNGREANGEKREWKWQLPCRSQLASGIIKE
jgi:hypothetical protein